MMSENLNEKLSKLFREPIDCNSAKGLLKLVEAFDEEYVKFNMSFSYYHGFHCSVCAPDPSQVTGWIVSDVESVFGVTMGEALGKALLKAVEKTD